MAWIGIVLCVLQSGTFSGLNLALFGVSALRLRTLANIGDERAASVIRLRKDSNFALTTILWGNVATNVMLTLLSDSVMAGVVAFLFSTFVITFGGEIIPQAYFSRHALRMASLMAPMLRFYQIVLFPLAKPSALILDAWLGKESIDYLPEKEIREMLRQHVRAPESDIDRIEGIGAVNFLCLDDVLVSQEGETVETLSVVRLQHENGRPVFPAFTSDPQDPFLQQVQASGKRWVVITSEEEIPTQALDASAFLRAALFARRPVDPIEYCHRPVVVGDRSANLGELLGRLVADPTGEVVEREVILLWGPEKRIITGADLLGFLLTGITRRAP